MTEPSRGVIARVRFNHAPDGRGLEPKRGEFVMQDSFCGAPPGWWITSIGQRVRPAHRLAWRAPRLAAGSSPEM